MGYVIRPSRRLRPTAMCQGYGSSMIIDDYSLPMGFKMARGCAVCRFVSLVSMLRLSICGWLTVAAIVLIVYFS